MWAILLKHKIVFRLGGFEAFIGLFGVCETWQNWKEALVSKSRFAFGKCDLQLYISYKIHISKIYQVCVGCQFILTEQFIKLPF